MHVDLYTSSREQLKLESFTKRCRSLAAPWRIGVLPGQCMVSGSLPHRFWHLAHAPQDILRQDTGVMRGALCHQHSPFATVTHHHSPPAHRKCMCGVHKTHYVFRWMDGVIEDPHTLPQFGMSSVSWVMGGAFIGCMTERDGE